MFRLLRKLQIVAVSAGALLLAPQQMIAQPGQYQTAQPTIVATPIVQAVAAVAQSGEDQAFQGYLQLLAARARTNGVSEATIRHYTTGLTLNQRVIDLDRAQDTTSRTGAVPLFAPYRRDHVTASRIARGRSKYAEVAGFTPQIEQRYGVSAAILLAIWGHESDYGGFQGDFDLARSLASLAYEGRRRELFAQEFIAVLKMADQGVARAKLQGSWAGALGNPQFLPSMYLRLAVDGDGDGVRNVWTSAPDTLASIANYFKDAGWRTGLPWGVAVQVPAGFDRASVAKKLSAPECPRVHARHNRWLSIAEWRALGVQPLAPIGNDVIASLFEPDGPGSPAYLLTGNYRVILHYNCSNFYALSVGLLADAIAR